METRQYIVKVLIAIGSATALWAIALCLLPQSLAVAQPATNLENIGTSVTVKKIRVQGYTVFSDREIEKIIKAYQKKKLGFRQLTVLKQVIESK